MKNCIELCLIHLCLLSSKPYISYRDVEYIEFKEFSNDAKVCIIFNEFFLSFCIVRYDSTHFNQLFSCIFFTLQLWNSCDVLRCITIFLRIFLLQILMCRASVFDELIQYHSDGFMPNWRVNRAMGLAIVDVAQTALKYVVVFISVYTK